ncbi:substrate-binding periplasmic protein [Bdellovibrio sp. HCB337]|uniref:substrate-binding periplasmic protein n=1 Tax=Bdellovibrio sp. HCB337 TaxID=3394358 RepID=UPI0039A4321E
MTLKTSIFITIFFLPWVLFAESKIRIPVGAYIFTPYYELQDGKPKGLTIDTLEILNKMQSEYEFVITEMGPQRRYKMFEELQIEAVFFEDPAWQWNKVEHFSIPLGLKDEEVYFALTSKSEQANYFENLKTKRLVLVQGYHYRFAGMESDEEQLKKHYQLHFVFSYEASVLFVLGGRADIGIAPRSYLHTYFQKHPEQKSLFRIGSKPDHSFKLKVILSKKSKISKARMKTLIEQLSKNPEYQKSLAKYGLN